MPLTYTRALLADRLLECGAVKFGAFKLKLHEKHPEAPLSPIYFNLRTADHPSNPGPLDAWIMDVCGQLMLELAGGFKAYTGLPNAGEPFADVIERFLDIYNKKSTRIRLQKTENPDGTRQIDAIVEDSSPDGAEVVIFDDLVTGADTKREGANVLEASGKKVKAIVVLIDRMQGRRQELEAAGYTLKSVFTIEELLEHYVEKGLIKESKAAEVRNYIGLT